MPAAPKSAFASYQSKSYPYRFNGTLRVGRLAAGVPADPKKAEAWLKTKILDPNSDVEIARFVAEIMVDLGITDKEEGIARAIERRNLSMFHNDKDGLWIPASHLKSAMKEALSVAVGGGKVKQSGWGETRKFITNYFPEHVFVVGDRLHLGVREPSYVHQSFPKSRFGSSIQYNQVVQDVDVHFTVETDYDYDDDFWAMLWTTGERNGLGSMRSQGFGEYVVTQWDKLPAKSLKSVTAVRSKVERAG